MSEKLLRFLAEGKLWVTIVSQFLAFLLVWNQKIGAEEWLTISFGVPVAFITGSVLENKISTVTLKS